MNGDYETPLTSRRKALGAFGATLAAAPALMASSGAAAQASAPNGRPRGPIDPRDKYPKPPFPQQTQPWPGLT